MANSRSSSESSGRMSDAEFGRMIRAAIRGKRVRRRRLLDRHHSITGKVIKRSDPAYFESDEDYHDNNRDLINAILQALGGED